MSEASKHLRARAASSYLGISQSTFWRWVSQGRLSKGIRLSARATVWPLGELDAFLEKCGASSSAGQEG